MTKIAAVAGLLLTTPTLLQASDWYAFCYGKLPAKTICSAIVPKPADVSGYCKTWALGYGASVWGNHTATSTSTLASKQASKCDEILGGGGTPITTYQCQVETLCPGPTGDTSSISLENIGGTVTALTKSLAGKKCVSTYSVAYLAKLKDHAESDCYIKAVVTE
jgi:hypothetical protein